MKELLDKLSSYNIFNYMLPGILFSVLASKMTKLELIQKDLVVGVFLYYFVGLIISRFGSLIIEPLLKKFNFLKFAEYKDFVHASSKDGKIEILSEVNNMYRTLVSTFVLIGVVKLYCKLAINWIFLNNYSDWILVIMIVVMFIFSYRKQTNYITKRINTQIKDNE